MTSQGLDIAPNVSVTFIGAVDASGTPVHNVFYAPVRCTVRALYMVNGSAVAAHATDIATQPVNRLRAAAGTAIATQTTATGTTGYAAIAADVPYAINLISDALAILAAGDVLQWAPTEGGTATSGDLTEAAFITVWTPGP